MSGVTLTGGSVVNGTITGTGAVELSESGGRALKLQTDMPHLVSMGGGRLSTAVTLHPIPQGRVTLGSGPGVDIPVQGTGVLPLHCHIENSEGVVTIYPLSENLSIDGVKITGPTRLSQGVMLTIGRSNYMRFNHPAEAKLMKSVLPNSRISMAPINFDVDSNQCKNQNKPPTIPRKSPRESLSDSGSDEPPSNIMMKVSKFEYLAAQNFKKSISPKVFSSNLVTVNTPARDVLGKAPPDLQNFTKNLPQSALNYSDLNYNEKQKIKTPDRQIFGRKSPQYVNVTINDTKSINNKVIIYENGCIPKNMNVNLDHNELNINKTSGCSKNVNVHRFMTPSPSYNRNPAPYSRSVTASPVCNLVKYEQNRSGSLGELVNGGSPRISGSLDDLVNRKNEAELRRNKAQVDRMKEQEIEKAEQARLEEIINMCAEYEKQAQCEKNSHPTPNRIKTNGSLPRDKRQCVNRSPNYVSPPPSPRDAENLNKSNNHSYENVTPSHRSSPSFNYENVNVRNAELASNEIRTPNSGSPYENVVINISPNYPHSPRTRIKTFLTTSKDISSRDAAEIVENKFAILNTEQYLLQNLNRQNDTFVDNKESLDSSLRKSPSSKFILPLDHDDIFNCSSNQTSSFSNSSGSFNVSNELNESKIRNEKQEVDRLKKEKSELLIAVAKIKRQMAEIEIQGEELHRELEMEKALIVGEHKSKLLDLEKLENRKQKLQKRAQKIEASMRDCQMKQEVDQMECKRKLQAAQENMNEIEKKLNSTTKSTPEYDQVFEEYLLAQEMLDNERKAFEDLEFHHLEEEADWLATREELQREISDLNKRIDDVKSHIEDLEQQKLLTSNSNVPEFKTMERQRVDNLLRLEDIRNHLKVVDTKLRSCTNQESDPEVSSDSDSDKGKGHRINMPVSYMMHNMSCSVIESSSKKIADDMFNMSQSFNEKMLQEKNILEVGLAKRCPSQDDIDRISKVTSDAPMNIDEERGSLGRKTIESLKEIEQNRHVHLCQLGSHVIEQERKRVLALKQRVQQEVRSKWAQRRQDCTSLTSTGSEETHESVTGSEDADQKNEANISGNDRSQTESLHPESESPDSPRPLSETSDASVEVGGTLSKRRSRPLQDKHRPLTRYLPIRRSDLDLRQHIETAGHQVVLCPHVIINSVSCRGFLHKKGSKLNGWSRRWFVFDRNKHTFVYYADKSEKKPKGGAYFQAIEEVYLDHSNSVKSPNPQLTFIVKTHERVYYLMAPSPEAMRIWIDVIFTGAEGYQEFELGT